MRVRHAFRDGALGDGETKNFMTTVKVGEALPAPDAALVNDDKEDDWAAESYALGKSSVYVDPIGPGLGFYTATAAYAASAQPIRHNSEWLSPARGWSPC